MGSYQDYVIKSGKLIGDFEGLYRDFEDPWHQSRADHQRDTRRRIAIDWCQRLREQQGADLTNRTIELGCGFGYLTDTLRQLDFSSVGVDVAQSAIDLARVKNPASVYLTRGFEDPTLLNQFDPDIVIMAEITWYVLDHLRDFNARLRDFAAKRDRPTFLIHLLTTYGAGIQQYGRDYFTDLDSILAFFDLNYLEAGFTLTPRSDDPLSQGTFFVAEIPRQG